MRYKISKISLIIFLFSNNFKLLGDPCEECLYCCCDVLSEDYKEKIKEDCKSYIEYEINNAKELATSDKKEIKNYEFQTNILCDFVEHYKKSKEVLPDYFFYVLDSLLKIPIANADLISIMKKELDYETTKEQLEYIEIDQIETVETIEKMEDKNKRYILRKEKNQIELDLDRTFPKIIEFQTKENLEIFGKIIFNFISQLYKSGINTGYSQGMNFYAGFFFILCKDEDSSGQVAFKLLYLFMTKEWPVNKYLAGTVTIDKGTYKNPNWENLIYDKEYYSFLSFFGNDYVIERLVSYKIIDNIPFYSEYGKRKLNEGGIFISYLVGLGKISIPMIKRLFFLIFLVKNCKIFFDILNLAAKFINPPNFEYDDKYLEYYTNQHDASVDFYDEFNKKYSEEEK